tara:strand:- start:783 stop:1505 length:723 start_codon:yes stop_codon:yes gene_type:complete
MTKLTLPVYVSTNDKHTECLKVFTELYRKFWKGQEFNVLGYAPTEVGDMGTFHSMGKQGSVKEWSTDLLKFFGKTGDDYFIYGTEDSAFFDHTDTGWINRLTEIIKKNPTIGRINLVNPCDREGSTIDNNPHYKADLYQNHGDWDLYKLTKDSNYAITAQMSIWNKKFFLDYCQPNYSPWDFELNGSSRWAENQDFSVLLVYGEKYPISKVEAYASTRGWENKEAWIDLISPSLREEIKL